MFGDILHCFMQTDNMRSRLAFLFLIISSFLYISKTYANDTKSPIIFIPGSLGWIVSRLFDATHAALDETVEAIKEFRKSSNAKEELDNFLRASQSNKTKAIIAQKRTEVV